LFLAHGQSAWFQERYSHEPQYIAMRKRLCRQGRVPTVETYIAEVREGKWDDVGYDMTGQFPSVKFEAILMICRGHYKSWSINPSPRRLAIRGSRSCAWRFPSTGQCEPCRSTSSAWANLCQDCSTLDKACRFGRGQSQAFRCMSELTMVDVLPDQGILALSHNGAFAQKAILPSCLGPVH
jgi:hypothetical protein